MPIEEIKNHWFTLMQRIQCNDGIALAGLSNILRNYTAEDRHYHNLRHISDLIELQQHYAPVIVDNDSVLLAIYFHDIIYRPMRSDNEEKSAREAQAFLQKAGYPEEKQQKVVHYIVATKGHQNPLPDTDLDYLLDFDLHMLGALPAVYDNYTKLVRKEYALYPSFIYKRGRRRVLQHFLSQPGIYKTAAFREKYELKARENMERELESL